MLRGVAAHPGPHTPKLAVEFEFFLALIVKPRLDYHATVRILKPMLEHHSPVDRVFHALGDPARRAIVERLSRGPASVSELAEPFEITLAAVVQHIQVLEQSGVITTKKEGRVRTCRLDSQGLATAEAWIAQRRAAWEKKLDRLGALLDEEEQHEAEAPQRKTKK
jgi:DNA-binding transcriptional ArsR family regulator